MRRPLALTTDQADCCAPGCCEPTMSRRTMLLTSAAFAVGVVARPLLAAHRRATYAETITADPDLRGYWRFEGDRLDVVGQSQALGGDDARFVAGAVAEGRAIQLVPDQPLHVAETKHLRGRSATLEMFFKVVRAPEGDAHPVLLAESSGQHARYIVGIKRDLSVLLYRNENANVVTEIHLPTDEPIELGRWYHLAVTSYDLDVRAYVDGYECSLVGGAYEFTRRGPTDATMTFGGTPVDGWSSNAVCLDEVACYARGLTQAEIQRHLDAAGWGQALAETGALVAQVKARRDTERARKAQAILDDPGLTAPGQTRVYEGEHLDAISFMVGGIGAGAIQFNGKAEPTIWQIACNYTQHRVAESFLAIRVQVRDGQPILKALQTAPAGPFEAMASLTFEGEYPLARYRFHEPELPVRVATEVFSPFIPMDLKNSALPCAIYRVTVENTSAEPVTLDVLAFQKNALGFHEGNGDAFGGNQTRAIRRGNATLLHMTRPDVAGADMVLMSRASSTTAIADVGSIEQFHRTLSNQQAIDGPEVSAVSPEGESVVGALAAPLVLEPGQSESVEFVLAWYFTEGDHGTGETPTPLEGEGEGLSAGWSHQGQNYTNWWPDALGVAEYLLDHLDDLTARTRTFHDTLYASNLPVWLLDRLSSQLAVLRSQTCWWAADGYFGVWEGCNEDAGCCPGNCTHVWHYAQGHARLLPELGRRMREQDYAFQAADGLTPYRHTRKAAAADGFFGTILNTYREHLCSPDDRWLHAQWPKVKRGMEWAITQWDPERDGWMENAQHNTLDGELFGCSSWIGTLYLSALEAAARMADVVGDAAAAVEYRAIRTSGKQLQNERLWNGQYYVQQPGKERRQDYLDGCHIDQILGEWWADQLGIDRNYPPARSRQAMEALLKHNFFTDFHGQSLKPRQYCEIDDGGMKMITWPIGPQPIPGMKYGDEVMTGFEYGAAATMIQNGLLKEGLMVAKVISDRYDGRLRTDGVSNVRNGPWGYSGNPFGDDECGKFYGRSLSVWSLLLALQGFTYDGPAGRIGFKPRLRPEDHASLFTAAEGYGLFTQTQTDDRLHATLKVADGRVKLREVALGATGDQRPTSATATLDGTPLDVAFTTDGTDVRVSMKDELVLQQGQTLSIELAFAAS